MCVNFIKSSVFPYFFIKTWPNWLSLSLVYLKLSYFNHFAGSLLQIYVKRDNYVTLHKYVGFSFRSWVANQCSQKTYTFEYSTLVNVGSLEKSYFRRQCNARIDTFNGLKDVRRGNVASVTSQHFVINRNIKTNPKTAWFS